MLGMPVIYLMPLITARSKIIQIEYYGGQCHFVDKASQVRSESALLADKVGGYFMDQFTYAERATDWRGNNNIAESIFQKIEQEPHSTPDTVVMSASWHGRHLGDARAIFSL